ncbi:MAG: methionine adenosyltransferase [Candidatus Marinimicrobia bacterium]|nr:methionine adenosyltransferase [Candidatus Neomarinimicrobiota bacterium]
MLKKYLFTSESVTEGHPDKVCDMVSDAILDAILNQDKNARVACETMVTMGKVIVSGEITTSASIDYKKIVSETISLIGYSENDLNNDDSKYQIEVIIKQQSPHIAQGVNQELDKEQGAGDQGLMFGYACNETEELMPLPIMISHSLTKKLSEVRKNKTLNWLKPDGKSQVTVEYNAEGLPILVKKVVLATQHNDMLNDFGSVEKEHSFIEKNLINHVIIPVLNEYDIKYDNEFIINGTGRFVEGGPIADVGLTGRKIIVDTYGGYSRHGGGAFSGKDPSKVDRSAAYMSRYIAKNIVASKIAEKCEIQLSYCIGVSNPTSVHVDTFGTSKYSNDFLENMVKNLFDLKPSQIISKLKLKNPIYGRFASYGHFGRQRNCSWEKTDLVNKIKEFVNSND